MDVTIAPGTPGTSLRSSPHISFDYTVALSSPGPRPSASNSHLINLTMNPSTLTSPSPPHPGLDKFFVHHFNYKIDNLEDNIEAYQQKYYEIVGVTPEHMKLKDNNKTLHVKLQTRKETIHNADILNELSKYGIELKLSNNQMDQNSIFCLGIPAEMTKIKKQKIIKSIEENNKKLKIMDIYLLPLKSKDQILTSIKISLATQEMVDKTLSEGLSFCNHKIAITQISRAKVLGTHQCFNCFSFDHPTESCNKDKKCLHCGENHLYKHCPNKTKNPKCANCSGNHKPNSNRCNTRKKYLIIPVSDKDPDVLIVKNPESNYTDNIPTSNPWFNKEKNKTSLQGSSKDNFTVLKHQNKPIPRPAPFSVPSSSADPQITPTTSYSDVLNMALKFNNWSLAFKELQKAFGLPLVLIPDSIVNDLKPEYTGNSTNSLPQEKDQTENHKTMPNTEPDNSETINVPTEPDNNTNNYPINEPDNNYPNNEVSYAEQTNETPFTIKKPKNRGRPKKVNTTSQNIQEQAASNVINIQPTQTYVVANREIEDKPKESYVPRRRWICVPVNPKQK